MDTLFGESEPETSDFKQKFTHFAQIAIEQSIDLNDTGLTYGIPEALIHEVKVGRRVWVPLGRGNQPVAGFVTEISEANDGKHRIKAIAAIDETRLSLPASLIELARWMASYYVTPLGMVLASMLPAAVKKGVGLKKKNWISLSPKPEEQPATDKKIRKPSALQAAMLEILGSLPESNPWIEQKALLEKVGAKTSSPLNTLIKRQVLKRVSAYHSPAPRRTEAIQEDVNNVGSQLIAVHVNEKQKPVLSQAQAKALGSINESLDSFKVNLLFGVTGSGKTEVYLQAIESVLKRGQGAIVLVPEIALTPQTAGRFTERFGGIGNAGGTGGVAILHSGLKASQRQQYWRAIERGELRLVVGARSAVMAPVPYLGLIVVDEEHDTSYKQDQLPRYHARDVAIRRGQMLNIPVVLGSATPSLESYANCQKHPAYQMLTMNSRVGGAELPKVHIVDLNEDRRQRYQLSKSADAGHSNLSWRLISIPLEKALRHAFDQGRQAILLLNRRGYANYIACPDHACGWSMQCDYCDASMVYHRQSELDMNALAASVTGGQMRCHHCGAESLLPKFCPVCGKKLTVFGLGTQRVEEEIKTLFPEVSITRMDSDTMRQMDDYQDALDAFRRGETNLLLGTQMIAKGLDFPGVTVVGVISSDTALNLPDFRATERTYQLISQVAGRAGRGEHKGNVYLQTFSPEDPTIKLASETDFVGFAVNELTHRDKLGFPPTSRMIRIIVRDLDRTKANDRIQLLKRQIATVLNQLKTDPHQFSTFRMIGPGPCAIERVAEFHRYEMMLFSQSAGELQLLMTQLRSQFKVKSDYGLAIDVDPVGLL